MADDEIMMEDDAIALEDSENTALEDVDVANIIPFILERYNPSSNNKTITRRIKLFSRKCI